MYYYLQMLDTAVAKQKKRDQTKCGSVLYIFKKKIIDSLSLNKILHIILKLLNSYFQDVILWLLTSLAFALSSIHTEICIWGQSHHEWCWRLTVLI